MMGAHVGELIDRVGMRVRKTAVARFMGPVCGVVRGVLWRMVRDDGHYTASVEVSATLPGSGGSFIAIE
jgi:hypothetical protein